MSEMVLAWKVHLLVRPWVNECNIGCMWLNDCNGGNMLYFMNHPETLRWT